LVDDERLGSVGGDRDLARLFTGRNRRFSRLGGEIDRSYRTGPVVRDERRFRGGRFGVGRRNDRGEDDQGGRETY
jgi:hypothetical protein